MSSAILLDRWWLLLYWGGGGGRREMTWHTWKGMLVCRHVCVCVCLVWFYFLPGWFNDNFWFENDVVCRVDLLVNHLWSKVYYLNGAIREMSRSKTPQKQRPLMWVLWCESFSMQCSNVRQKSGCLTLTMDLNSLPDGISIFDMNRCEQSAYWKRIPRRYIKAYCWWKKSCTTWDT